MFYNKFLEYFLKWYNLFVVKKKLWNFINKEDIFL